MHLNEKQLVSPLGGALQPLIIQGGRRQAVPLRQTFPVLDLSLTT